MVMLGVYRFVVIYIYMEKTNNFCLRKKKGSVPLGL